MYENAIDIPQRDFEDRLFKMLRSFGFGSEYVDRYRMISTFHVKRIPLLVFVMGTECTGYSSLSVEVAARLSIPRIVQSAIVLQLHGLATDDRSAIPALTMAPGVSSLQESSLYRRRFASDAELLAEFDTCCTAVRTGHRRRGLAWLGLAWGFNN